jgi:Protein of unknown function (DUF2934)
MHHLPESEFPMPKSIHESIVPPAIAVPTEAETRAADLEQDDSAARNEQTPDRAAQIRQAAYARSERRGFEPGHEEEDWLEAERDLGSEQSDEPGRGKRPDE